MCRAKTPAYQAPPQYARAQEPDNAALYDEAKARAEQRGSRRRTVLSGLRGRMQTPALTTQTGERMTTVLG